MIVFPKNWGHEVDEQLARREREQRARRLAFLRQRLQTPRPAFASRPGTRTQWDENDAAIVRSHVRTLARLLGLSKIAREDHPNPLALKAALILHAPLLEAGPEAIGLLGLHSRLFVDVVAEFDRQQANTQANEAE